MEHFSEAHGQLLHGRNTNIEHLVRNIRRDRRFETLLMKIASYDEGVDFNLDSDIINELATYGCHRRRCGRYVRNCQSDLSVPHHSGIQVPQ